MRVCSLVLLAVVATLVLSCGGGSETTTVDAAKVLATAVESTKKVTSFHFRFTHENGTTPLPPSFPLALGLDEAEGDIVVPDQLSADVKAKASPVSLSTKIIVIGDKTWLRNPFTHRWESLSNISIADIADPVALLNTVLGALKDPQIASETEIDKVKAYRLTGTLDASALKTAFDFAETGRSVSVELLIGIADGLPRRARLNGRMAENEAANIARQIDLTRFNEKVDIRPPE